MNLSIKLANPCSGGCHFDVTVTAGAKDYTFRCGPELFEAITDADKMAFAKVLIRLLAAECKSLSRADLIAQLHNLSLTIAPRAAT